MLCEKCGKHIATNHISSIVNGVAIEKHLCSYCAKALGLELSSHSPFTGVFSSMLGEFVNKELSVKKCSVCGCTFSQIAKSGKVGCSQCYITFKEELLPYLKRVHGSTKHIGKCPENMTEDFSVSQLKSQLRQLVAEENYEEAAKIRDKIKELEAENNG